MIISLKVGNFYSIKNEQVLNLAVSKQAPDNFGYSNAVIDRVSKLGMLVGANASGKTNILKAFAFLQSLILKQENISLQNLYKKFFDSEEVTNFEVVFEKDKIRYEYTLSLSKDKILNETLKQTKDATIKTGTATIFAREFSGELNKYLIKSNLKGFPTEIDIVQRSDISIFSIGVILNIPLLVELTNYWRNVATNVPSTGWHFDSNGIIDLIALDNDKVLKGNVEEILRKYDLGLEEVFIEKTEISPNQFSLKSSKEKHTFKGKTYESDMADASRGTQKLIGHLRLIVSALQKGSTVIIDELDAYLHPKIVTELVSLFLDEEKNTNNAQLLFSSHSHSVMNMLDKYQIFIAEKNTEGSTELSRLDDFGSDVRNGENFYNRYISGYYGGVPKL